MNDLTCNHRCNQALCRLAEGDTNALTVIYDCMARQMFALALSILKNHADAEDAMQEAFLKVIQSIGTYRKDGNARAWLMSITRNTAIDIMRKKKDTVCIEDFSAIPKHSDRKDFTEQLILGDALMNLEQNDREIIVLKIVSGMKFREISELVGLPLTTVQKRYQRALKNLKRQLKP